MKLQSDTFADRDMIPDDCAFGLFEPGGKLQIGRNLNPHLRWRDLPRGTKSLALINDDLDVPVDVGTFNQAGEVVSRLQERRALCHWVLVNLAPDDREIGLGEFSNGVAVGGKPGPDGPRGTLQGLNEYTDWFINDPVMAGKYFGYDGPCPPYNDEVAHRYVFTLYALDAARLQVDTVFDKHGALREISNHILASASITGTFSSNRSVRPRSG